MGLADLDPGVAWNAQREAYQRLVFDTLINFDDVTGEQTLRLAKTLEWTDETCTAIHVVLRDDVVFSNGDKVTATDVEFSLGRNTYSNMVSYYDHTEIISDTEMIIHLKSPYMSFLRYLSRACGSIVCKAEAEKHPEGLALIGSGPYKYDMDTYVAANKITLVRNDKFWGEASPTEKINIVKISDASAAGVALQNSEVNFVYNLNPNELPQLEADEDVEITEFTSYNFIYMGFNDKCDTEALTEEEINFRRAVACAINRDDIIAGIGGGMHMATMFPFDNPAYMANTSDYEHDMGYNPEKAKEYLAKAGGKTEFTALVNTSSSWLKVSAQVIQENLRQVGITMNIEETDTTGFSSMTQWGKFEYDAFIHSNLFTSSTSGYGFWMLENNVNRSTVTTPEVIAAAEAAAAATTEEEQIKQHQIMLKATNETVSNLPLVWRNMNYGYTTGLEGVIVGAGPTFDMRDIALRID